jgi:ParB-like chromosome segregation protein Spo0J
MTQVSPGHDGRNSELRFHPLADIFPLMEGEEFDELVADIKAHGLIEPVALYDEMILDGRNRYRACIKAGLEPKLTPFRGSDPAAFVISKNINRRHLTTAQRAAIAADLATMKSGARTDLAGNQARSQSEAAKLLNVSRDSAQRATEVKKASPELHEQVKEGKISLAAAERAVAAIDAPAGGKRAAKKAKAERNHRADEAPSNGPVKKRSYPVAERAAIDLLDQLARVADDYEVEFDHIDLICERYGLILLRQDADPDEIADKVVEAIGIDRARDEAKKIGRSIKQRAGRPPLPDCDLCNGTGLMEGELMEGENGTGKTFKTTFKTDCPCVRRKGSDEDYRAKRQEERAEQATLEREMLQPFSFGVEATTKDGRVWTSGVRLRSEEEAKLYILSARWELKKHGYWAWDNDPDKPCDITFDIKQYDEPPIMWFKKKKGRKRPTFCFPHGTCGLMNWRLIAGDPCDCKGCQKTERQRKAHERRLEAFNKNNKVVEQAFATGKISQKQLDEWNNSPCTKTPKWLTQLKKATALASDAPCQAATSPSTATIPDRQLGKEMPGAS